MAGYPGRSRPGLIEAPPLPLKPSYGCFLDIRGARAPASLKLVPAGASRVNGADNAGISGALAPRPH